MQPFRCRLTHPGASVLFLFHRNGPDMDGEATILHADLDAFYASVEQMLNPELRGKPIAVGGGVVLACSYEAKAFGVRGGMSGRQARGLGQADSAATSTLGMIRAEEEL